MSPALMALRRKQLHVADGAQERRSDQTREQRIKSFRLYKLLIMSARRGAASKIGMVIHERIRRAMQTSCLQTLQGS